MSILIRTDASPEIGTGHAYRMLALVQALRDIHETVTLLSSCMPQTLHILFMQEGCAVIKRNDIKPGTHEDALTTSVIARERRSSWVVIDGYHFDYNYQRTLRECSHSKILVVDDLSHCAAYCADAILNSNVYSSPSMYDQKIDEYIGLLGTDYVLLRREFLRPDLRRMNLPRNVQSIMLMFGGSDPRSTSEIAIDAVNSPDFVGIHRSIIVGPAHRGAAALRALAEDSGLNVLIDVTDMPHALRNVDLAVTAGGSSVFELLYLGVPALVTTVAENQARSVEALASSGAIGDLGPAVSLSPARLRAAVLSLVDDFQQRSRQVCMGRRLVDGGGAGRVARMIQSDGR